MDTIGYSNWGREPQEVPTGRWGRWEPFRRRLCLLVFALLVATVLWALILSILSSRASMEREALLSHQDLLRTNASEQMAVLGALENEVRGCKSCCSGITAQLQTALFKLHLAQAKLEEQEGALEELQERVTQGLAEAGRDREDVRRELLQALEAAKLNNGSCEQCPGSWLLFQGSCYRFSDTQGTWEAAQRSCTRDGAHLVIVGGLDEQGFLTRNTRGRGYWLGLRGVRRLGKIQGYQWVDGVPLTFSYWNVGEPNDARGREDCVMMLASGLWNDAPCTSDRDYWICERRSSC